LVALLLAASWVVARLCLAESPPAPTWRFYHLAHAKLKGVGKDCALCHGARGDGQIEVPGSKGHQPCLSAGCHVQDFLSLKSKDAPAQAKAKALCLGCHSTAENFRKNPANRMFLAARKQYHVELSHRSHEPRPGPMGRVSCQNCHAPSGDRQETPGHAQCAVCHAVGNNASPAMTMCGGCHLDGAPTGAARAETGEFHVELSHAAHTARTLGGAKVVCFTCHQVDKGTMAYGERPGHPQCAACHAKDSPVPMSQCGACHQPGSEAAAFAKRRVPTDVAKKFAHENEHHPFATTGVQCGECHLTVAASTTLGALKAQPIVDGQTMSRSCGRVGCHKDDVKNGQKCKMCHAANIGAALIPMSHR
jgi:hypothetical protein